MAVAKPPPELLAPIDHLGEEGTLGPLLFAKLVPYAVHQAVAVYEERRDRLVSNDIVQKIEELNATMRDLLRDLNIPGALQALERPLGVPTTTNQHADEMRQADAVVAMERSLRELENLRADNMRQYERGRGLLEAERAEDDRLRQRYGTDRWTRPAGPDDDGGGKELHDKAAEIQAYFAQSADSDALVRSTFDQNYDMLSLLCGPERDLVSFIPSSRVVDLPDTLKSAIGKLRSHYNDAQRLESRRRKKLESVQDVRRRDDVKPEILKEAGRLERTRPNMAVTAADFELFFNKRLDKTYDDVLDSIDRDVVEQDKVLAELQIANREFESQVRRSGGAAGGGEERRDAIQKLENAYGAYKQIQYHLGVARSFYNDLLKVTGNGFVARIEKWAAERRAAARELEE
jgi:programmed cell death 6-interacting protein